LRDEMQL